MRTSVVSDTDFKTGKVSTYDKLKPEAPTVKGICKISVVDAKTGETEREIVAENIYKDALSLAAYFTAANPVGAWSGDAKGQGGNSSEDSANWEGGYTGGLREIHLLNDTSSKEDAKYNSNEGFIEAWADFASGYSGADSIRGNRSEILTTSHVDDATGELVFKYGFIFDQTKANTTFNKIGLTPMRKMGYNWASPPSNYYGNREREKTISVGSSWKKSNGQQSWIGNMALWIDYGSVCYPDVKYSNNDNDEQVYHHKYTKMCGNLWFWMPHDYSTRNNFAFKVTDITKNDSVGKVSNVTEVVLSNTFDTKYRYSTGTNITYNPKTKRLYYVSVDYTNNNNPLTVIEFNASDLTVTPLPIIKEVTIPLTTSGFMAGKERYFPYITPVIDYTSGTLDILFANKKSKVTAIELDSSLAVKTNGITESNIDQPLYNAFKVAPKRYIGVVGKNMHDSCRNYGTFYSSYKRSFLYGSYNFCFGEESSQVAWVAWAYDIENSKTLPMDRGTLTANNYDTMAIFNEYNASFFCMENVNAPSSSTPAKASCWYQLMTYVPPQEYLFVDNIPAVTKTDQQQVHIEYELRFPNNSKTFGDPFTKALVSNNKRGVYFGRGDSSGITSSEEYNALPAGVKATARQIGLQFIDHKPPLNTGGAITPPDQGSVPLPDPIVVQGVKNTAGNRSAMFSLNYADGKLLRTFKTAAAGSTHDWQTMSNTDYPFDVWLNQGNRGSSGWDGFYIRLTFENKSTNKTIKPPFLTSQTGNNFTNWVNTSTMQNYLIDSSKSNKYVGPWGQFSSSSSWKTLMVQLVDLKDGTESSSFQIPDGENLSVDVTIEFCYATSSPTPDQIYKMFTVNLQI